MRTFNEILSNLRESESDRVASLVREISNVADMYDEIMVNDSEDVFSGTQDSYANEMLEQNLFDSIYYNELFSGLDDNKKVELFNEVMDYIATKGEITEEWLKGLLDKYKVIY